MRLSHVRDLEVLERKDNGSGRVRMPVLVEAEIKLVMTAGGGKGTVVLTGDNLREMVENFKKYILETFVDEMVEI